MRFGLAAGLALAALLWCGCSRPGSVATAGARTEPSSSGQPQPRLPTIKLWLGPKEINAEQAIQPNEVQTGMMFRKEMGENEGMLFVFDTPRWVSFWMRNTLLPLTCAYIDASGTVLELHDMKPLDEKSIEASSDQIQYALEMKQGWFERNNIGHGTVMRSDRGSLSQGYFGQP